MRQTERRYWKDLSAAIQTLWGGLLLSFGHILKSTHTRRRNNISDEKYFDEEHGLVTLQYPHEVLPIPDTGRYRLHNEMDDCIVCDKCAKICPVDCIEIEAIRSPVEYGRTSDGTPKRIYGARFDIDMAKCCFCGLCTTDCPTECLTMTKVYDFAEFDVRDHIYSFATMSPEEIELRTQEWDEHVEKTEAEKAAPESEEKPAVARPRPKMGGARPKMKPKMGGSPSEAQEEAKKIMKSRPKPVMKPKTDEQSDASGDKKPPRPKPVMKPKAEGEKRPKPVMKPRPKPIIKPKDDDKKEDEE